MQYEIVGRSTQKRKFLEAIMPSLVKQLHMESSKASVLISMEADCPHTGLTVPLANANLYMVVLDSRQRPEALGVTLAHEMVHVAQMAKGTLRSATRGGTTWAGRRYSKNTPYLERPWEIQAFAKQELLLRRALDGA
jgi:hypothetical protein